MEGGDMELLLKYIKMAITIVSVSLYPSFSVQMEGGDMELWLEDIQEAVTTVTRLTGS